jgi:membrane protein
MARLRDITTVFSSVGAFGFTKRVWGQVVEDNLFTWASALAYSWLFAIFPFLIFVLSLLPYLPGEAKAQAKEEIGHFVHQLPDQAAEVIWKNVTNVLDRPKQGLLIVGLGVAVWAASGGMATTMGALDKCYELDAGRPFYKQRPLALLLTLVVATLILAVLILLPVGTAMRTWAIKHEYLKDTDIVWVVLFDLVRYVLALLFLITSLTIIYHFGPSVKHKFHWLTPGAVFCLVVWVVLGVAFRTYVQRFGKYEQTYGTVGGVAVLLLFFYVDALVLLVGAEINSEIDFEVLKVKRGTRDFRPAERITEIATAAATAAPASLANINVENESSTAPAAEEGAART